MANRYANLVGSNKIKDEYQKINIGFDKVEQEMDEKPDNSFARINDVEAEGEDAVTIEAGTGITVTTTPEEKKIRITATGEAAPGPHGSEHNHDGADPIPDLVQLQDEVEQFMNDFHDYRSETISGVLNVKTQGVVGDGVTDDTTAIADAINSANGRPIFFPPGIYAATQIAFPNNAHVIFFNAKFVRIGGTGPFITTGQNSIIFGNVEIDGNKTNITGAKGDVGIRLQAGTKCFARVNSHDNHGHGIVLESNTDIYSPVAHSNGMTYDPDGTGEGDGIYTSNSENVNIINPYAYNNSRMGIAVTTFPTDPDACRKVKIINPHVHDNAYLGVDVEYASECIIQNLTGWDKMASSNSKDCIYENLQVRTFYGDNTERVTVKKVKCKPLGNATNVFLLRGSDPVVEDLYVFDTATAYTSNTVEIRDSVNSRAVVKNVVIEKGYNGFTGSGIFELRNVTVESADNRPYLIDSRAVRPGRMLEIINGFLRASNNAKPDTGLGYTGTYKVGDIVWNDAPTELGDAGNKYVVQGWLCTAAGNPATWLEMRTLTGN